MTVIGPDRPGIVGSLADWIRRVDGSWLESRLGHLGGQFAGIVHCTIPKARTEEFLREMGRLKEQGLEIAIHEDSGTPPGSMGAARRMRLEVLGHDRPGIVHTLANALADRGVNVEELETSCESAPMSGELLFRARALLSLPPPCDMDALSQELRALAEDLALELSLERVDSA